MLTNFQGCPSRSWARSAAVESRIAFAEGFLYFCLVRVLLLLQVLVLLLCLLLQLCALLSIWHGFSLFSPQLRTYLEQCYIDHWWSRLEATTRNAFYILLTRPTLIIKNDLGKWSFTVLIPSHAATIQKETFFFLFQHNLICVLQQDWKQYYYPAFVRSCIDLKLSVITTSRTACCWSHWKHHVGQTM
jgi:hypothetical protein